MSVCEKIKTVDNKIVQNKAQYNLDRQIAKVSALPSGNVSKYEFLTGKYVLLEKDLLEKPAAINKFEYSPLDKQMKKKTRDAGKQYQKFDNAFESNKKEEVKTKTKRVCAKLNLVYNNYFSFRKYHKIKEFLNVLLIQNSII